MRRFAVLLLLALPLFAGEPRAASLAWMSGCWSAEGSDEYWMQPAGGALFGIGRTVRNGKLAAYEFMQIREQDGTLVFTASPSGQATASFRLVRLGENSVLFENPEHDFPQRISYTRNGDQLIGRIEGGSKAIEYPLTRAKCE